MLTSPQAGSGPQGGKVSLCATPFDTNLL